MTIHKVGGSEPYDRFTLDLGWHSDLGVAAPPPLTVLPGAIEVTAVKVDREPVPAG
jgi:hypothetical protein